MLDAVGQFREALQARGLIPPVEILADGEIHRCNAEGRGGENDGAYLLHLDGIPAGGFENWRDGEGWETWRADIGRTLTPEEEAAQRTHTAAMRKAREAEDKRRKAEARERGKKIWDSALPCPGHPYLTRKGIKAHGARIVSTGYREGDLAVPLRDIEGKLHSLQFIGQDGGKLFLPGGRKRTCYFGIGKPAGVLYIAEGFATAASIHEATGQAVAVAFDAGNLLPVAEALRVKYPSLDLVIAADDDYRTDGNPGLTKATEAARAIGARIAFPAFGEDRPEKATDFNDLHQARGLESVRVCLERAEILPTGDGATEESKPFVHPILPRLPAWIVGDVGRMLTEDPPPVRWLVEGLIPAGVPGILAARASAGKSMTALLAAMGLASGLGVLGRPVSTEEARGVIFAGLEDDEAEFHRRVCRGIALLEEDPEWTEAHRKALACRLVPLFPNRASGERFSLEAQWRTLAGKAAAIPGGCGLIILDTLSRMAEGDENSAKDMRPFSEAVSALSQESGAAVLSIHHVGKGNDAPSDKQLWQRLHPEALRGSSAVEAAARFIIQMAALSPSEAQAAGLEADQALKGGYVAFSLSKISAAEKGSTVLLERRQSTEPGAGFLCPHPDSERILAVIQGAAAVLKLTKRDHVLLAIAEAGGLTKLEQKEAAALIWPDSASPKAQWDKMLSAIRKAEWLRDLALTDAGWAKAESLGFIPSARKAARVHNLEESPKKLGLPPGRVETEGTEGKQEETPNIPSFPSGALGKRNGRKEFGTDHSSLPAVSGEDFTVDL
jgi:putative DNA primase/helicase